VSQAVQTHLDEQLKEICLQLKANSLRVVELCKGVHHHQLNLRVETGTWSIVECIVHLNLFSEEFVPIIETACNEARVKGWTAESTFKMDFVGKVLKFALEPPSRWKAATRARFEPTIVEPLSEVAPKFYELQNELIRAVRNTSAFDLNRIKIASPASGRVRYNLYSCFLIIAAHQRRHLWQAEQARTVLLGNRGAEFI
jgi:hypothetical protein